MNALVKKAIELGAVEFINHLDALGFGYELHDADNMLDYNQGNFNIFMPEADAQLWFYDGVLVNVNGEEL